MSSSSQEPNDSGASYHTRKSFRRHLLEKEFADDYSLNPKNSHHNISATSNALSESAHRMTSIIQLKREQSIEKHSNFHQSRQQTALLDPELLLQTAIQKSFNDKMETDYEELMERYQRGDHIFKHHIQQEHNDIHLESTLYTNAASILSSSEVGKITKTYTKQDSKHYNQLKKLEQKEFKSKQQTLDKLKKRLDLYAEYLSGKTTSGQLEEIITELESKIEILTLEIENKKEEDDFDWLLERHNQIRKYKSELIVHREDLFHSQSCHEKIYQKICHQYPEMKDMLSLGILDIHEQKQMILQQLQAQAQAQAQSQTQSQTMTMTGSGLGKTLGSSTRVATTTTTTTAAAGGGGAGGGATGVPPPQIRMINASGEEISLVYGWIVGKLNLDGRITHLLFGQFTESDVPPSNGWIPLAKVIPVDSQNFLTVPNETVSKHGISEEAMSVITNDTLSCEVSSAQIIVTVPQQTPPSPAQEGATTAAEAVTEAVTDDQPSHPQMTMIKVPTMIQTVTLRDCSLPEVNGRYLESGFLHGTRKFSNVNGWNIFRYALEEIPEMDILASNCYPSSVESSTSSARGPPGAGGGGAGAGGGGEEEEEVPKVRIV